MPVRPQRTLLWTLLWWNWIIWIIKFSKHFWFLFCCFYNRSNILMGELSEIFWLFLHLLFSLWWEVALVCTITGDKGEGVVLLSFVISPWIHIICVLSTHVPSFIYILGKIVIRLSTKNSSVWSVVRFENVALIWAQIAQPGLKEVNFKTKAFLDTQSIRWKN